MEVKKFCENVEMPQGTVKSRLSRGKEELRKALERGGE